MLLTLLLMLVLLKLCRGDLSCQLDQVKLTVVDFRCDRNALNVSTCSKEELRGCLQ
jgi:hypothetical protein